MSADTRWTIIVAPLDETGVTETIVLTNEEADCFQVEGGIMLWTRPTGTGSYHDERLVPHSRLLDYRKETL